jgi:uncharacterized protein (TIGR02646 family)
MIFIDKSKIKPPAILVDSNKQGKKETLKAIKHYTNAKTKKKKFKGFKIYSHQDVKDVLQKVFKGKCAYCESKFLHVYPGDVEHFRPKAEITTLSGLKIIPGYYWLAADWDNLLLSCRNCNQKLKHLTYGSTSKKTMGKMNQFPLSNEVYRRNDHTKNITEEEDYRLLLNPCIDKPEEHLAYDEKNAIVKPKVFNGSLSEKAKKSIDVYVLQRMPLVQAREKLLIEIFAQMERVSEALDRFNQALVNKASPDMIYFNNILKRELSKLKKFTESDAEFSGMAKQVIGKFLNINFGIAI